MIVAEGVLDEVAAKRLVEHLGIVVDGTVFNTGGVEAFWEKLPRYNNAARHGGPIFALADHDSTKCVGPKLADKLKDRHPELILRLCVAELESWFLADAETIAAFLGVSVGNVPKRPDTINDPKQALVNLARTSQRREIRLGVVPKPGRSAVVGPEYTNIMTEYVLKKWRPRIAAGRSDSLRRAIDALQRATKAKRGE
jgi:hypothetical protein